MRSGYGKIFALSAIGGSALLWQVASVRAVLAGLYGNELTVGLVLGVWLLLVGSATGLTTRISFFRHRAQPILVLFLLLLPVGLLASWALQQMTLPAFDAIGRVVGPGRAAIVAIVCLLPACLLLGGAFGLVALAAPDDMEPGAWSARVYMVESIGTAVCGVIFHFWLAEEPFSQTGFVAALLPFIAALALFPLLQGRWRIVASGAACCGAGSLVFFAFSNLQPSVQGYELLSQQSSRHAALTVLRRQEQVLFLANGLVLFTNEDDERAEADLHLTLLAHPSPRRILMIGGGLGGGLREALKHPVEQVDYVELDRALIPLAKRWAPALTRPLADSRVSLLIGDGRQVVAKARDTYDLILVGLSDPSSALINRFYTEEFFRQAKRALRKNGILRVPLPGSETYLSNERAAMHATVLAGLNQTFATTPLPGGRTLFLASTTTATIDAETLSERLLERRIETVRFGAAEIQAQLLPWKQDQYREQLKGAPILRNTDLNPTVYFQASISWLAITSPTLALLLLELEWFRDHLLLVLAIAFFCSALFAWWRGSRGAGYAIALAGFAGMVVELCILLAVQETRGVIYHEIGILLAIFMVGLAIGAALGKKLAMHLALGGCGLLCLACAGAVTLAVLSPTTALASSLAALLLLGIAVGACFTPAAVLLGTGGVARAYAWDLAGAAGGVVVACLFALPVLGIRSACFLCASLCVGATIGFWLKR